MNEKEMLQSQIDALKLTIDRLEKQSIVIVGEYDNGDIPVTIQGKRRKITTSSP